MVFKGNKAELKEKLITYFKGTGLSDAKYIAMSEEFSDMPAIVEDYYLNEGGVIKQ